MLPILPNGLQTACEALEGTFDEDCCINVLLPEPLVQNVDVRPLFINFGLGGPDCFNANLSELDRRLKGTSIRDATELHTLATVLKLASDLIEDIPSRSLPSYL